VLAAGEAGYEVRKFNRGAQDVSIKLVIRLYWLFRYITLRTPWPGGVSRRPLDTAGCEKKQHDEGANQS
jgi:hypothetical protein